MKTTPRCVNVYVQIENIGSQFQPAAVFSVLHFRSGILLVSCKVSRTVGHMQEGRVTMLNELSSY